MKEGLFVYHLNSNDILNLIVSFVLGQKHERLIIPFMDEDSQIGLLATYPLFHFSNVCIR